MPSLALLVCSRCKKRKGKCDKVLPRCGFCRRNGWSCAYNVSYPPAFTNAAGSPQRSSNSPGFLQLNSAPLQFLTQPSASEKTMRADFPNAFFLDADIFRRSQLEIPIPGVSIPPYLIELLRHIENVRDMAASFFSDIYPWMPILSKSWFCNHLLNPLSPRRADSMLLLLSVRLITWFPSTPGALGSPDLGSPEDPRTPLYLAVKRFFLELETAGTFTLRHVQAGVLIGLYELGHAIYPAAYISVGVCARLAVALGFDKDIKRWTNTGLSWEQTEERRRVWWAILMLDRFVNVGNPSRMLATADPSSTDILPTDDVSWEDRVIPSGYPSTIGSSSPLTMGRFARFAQATYLLGQVYRNVYDRPKDGAFYEREAAQINRTLHALIHLSHSEAETKKVEFCTLTAVCYSALSLLDYHSPDNTGNGAIRCQSDDYPVITPIELSRDAALMSQYFLPGGPIPVAQVSPFILHLQYQACIILSNEVKNPGREEDIRRLSILRESLVHLRGRWLAAAAYDDLLIAREAMSAI